MVYEEQPVINQFTLTSVLFKNDEVLNSCSIHIKLNMSLCKDE